MSHDVVVASTHGAALLDYVLADMEAVGQPTVRTDDQLRGADGDGSSVAGVPLVTTP
jgi:hypothetical protein